MAATTKVVAVKPSGKAMLKKLPPLVRDFLHGLIDATFDFSYPPKLIPSQGKILCGSIFSFNFLHCAVVKATWVRCTREYYASLGPKAPKLDDALIMKNMKSYIWDTRHKLGKEEVTGIAKSQVNMNSFRLKAELKDYVSAHLPTATPYSQQQPS
jgi:hypothetical protein